MRDQDVRLAVRAHLHSLHEGDSSTRLVEEMGVWSGAVRVDMAVINGELSGFELKSDSDTLERLPNQVEIYGKVFDRMTLVVGSRHYDKALSRIPPWWGCIVARMNNGHVKLKPARKPKRNPNPDPAIVAQLLWKDEAVAILDKHGLAKGWRSKPSADVFRHLLSSLSKQQIAAEVRQVLKQRAKLGQLASGQLDMTIDGVADPTSRTPRAGSGVGYTVNHLIAPAMRQWEPVW